MFRALDELSDARVLLIEALFITKIYMALQVVFVQNAGNIAGD